MARGRGQQAILSQPTVPEEDGRKEDENDCLLAPDLERDVNEGRKGHGFRTPWWYYLVLALLVSLIVVLSAMMVVWKRSCSEEPRHYHSGVPPETYRQETFMFNKIYAEGPRSDGDKAWAELIPNGDGVVYLNHSLPALRPARISMFHQLKCLYLVRQGYFKARSGNLDEIDDTVLSYCWDYLRQSLLCAGDTTLEWLDGDPPSDVADGGLRSAGFGYRHKCKDYRGIRAWAEEHAWSD
ncbi:hypothetical protein F5Y17DRAFT_229496 [Xylariaceae sp. FL0594]|nr:hypothetical protein F5Y17DRAFT_229496 [Xylariaceae sp. FL0594]